MDPRIRHTGYDTGLTQKDDLRAIEKNYNSVTVALDANFKKKP